MEECIQIISNKDIGHFIEKGVAHGILEQFIRHDFYLPLCDSAIIDDHLEGFLINPRLISPVVNDRSKSDCS